MDSEGKDDGKGEEARAGPAALPLLEGNIQAVLEQQLEQLPFLLSQQEELWGNKKTSLKTVHPN